MPGPEGELLGALTIGASSTSQRQRELLARCRPEPLLALARQEGVAGLLYANLKRHDLFAHLPAGDAEALAALYHRTAALNLRKQADLHELGAALQADGPPVVLLKGMALLDTLYADPGTRATGDIDLRIGAPQRADLVAVLERLGFEPVRHYPDTFMRGSTAIDLHTHLLGTERIRARAAIFAAGEEPMLRHPRETAYGETITRLSPAAELLHLALHLWKHNADRLLWLIEINELAAELDDAEAAQLLGLARRMRQRRSLGRVAALAELLLGDNANRSRRALGDAAGTSRVDRWVLRRRATHGALPGWGPLLFYAAGRGVSARAATVAETLFPRPRVLRQVFADDNAPTWRLYARRVGQLVGLALAGRPRLGAGGRTGRTPASPGEAGAGRDRSAARGREQSRTRNDPRHEPDDEARG